MSIRKHESSVNNHPNEAAAQDAIIGEENRIDIKRTLVHRSLHPALHLPKNLLSNLSTMSFDGSKIGQVSRKGRNSLSRKNDNIFGQTFQDHPGSDEAPETVAWRNSYSKAAFSTSSSAVPVRKLTSRQKRLATDTTDNTMINHTEVEVGKVSTLHTDGIKRWEAKPRSSRIRL